MGLELGPCTRKSKVLPWSHARRILSLPSTVHNFCPQISVYNHFRRHFTPTILIHCLRMRVHEWVKKDNPTYKRLKTKLFYSYGNEVFALESVFAFFTKQKIKKSILGLAGALNKYILNLHSLN